MIAHLGTVGLPLSRHQLSNRLGEAEAARLLMHMKKDKKASAGHIVLIVPHGISDARIDRGVNEADVMAVLEGESVMSLSLVLLILAIVVLLFGAFSQARKPL